MNYTHKVNIYSHENSISDDVKQQLESEDCKGDLEEKLKIEQLNSFLILRNVFLDVYHVI